MKISKISNNSKIFSQNNVAIPLAIYIFFFDFFFIRYKVYLFIIKTKNPLKNKNNNLLIQSDALVYLVYRTCYIKDKQKKTDYVDLL